MLTSVFGFVAVMLAATFGITSISNTYHQVDLAVREQNRSTILTSVHYQACVPKKIAEGERVRGLAIDIPRLNTESERLDFDGSGDVVTYEVATKPDQVADFYFSELPSRCYQRVAHSDGVLVFQKRREPYAVRIALSESRIRGRSRVRYELTYPGSWVLGESTVRLEQESGTTLSSQGDSGQYPQPTKAYIKSFPGPYSPPQPPPQPSPSVPFSPAHPLSGDQMNQPYPREPRETQELWQYQGPSGMTGDDSVMNGRPAFIQRGGQGQFGQQNLMMEGRNFVGGNQNQNEQYGGKAGKLGEEDTGGVERVETQTQERRLKEMQQNMGQFIQQIEMMRKRVPMMRKKLQACGADFPEELNNALGSIDGLIGHVQSAQDPKGAITAMESLQDAAEVFRNFGPQMGDLMGYCQRLKQAETQVHRMMKNVMLLEVRVKARKADSAILDKLKSIVEGMKQSIATAKTLATTSVDEADAMIEAVFEQMDNYREANATVNMALDLPKGLREADATVRTIAGKIKTLERKKNPVVETLKPLLDKLKSQVAEIRAMAKGTIDPERLREALQDILEIREQIFDLLQEHGIESNFMPKVQTDQGFQFEFHDSFIPKDSL